jgi:hypothetical protein
MSTILAVMPPSPSSSCACRPSAIQKLDSRAVELASMQHSTEPARGVVNGPAESYSRSFRICSYCSRVICPEA